MILAYVHGRASPRVPHSPEVGGDDATDAPLGVGCIRAYALADPRLKGKVVIETRRFGVGRSPEEIASQIAAEAPDIVGLACYLWNRDRSYLICDLLRRRLPHAKIVVGGPSVPRDTVGLLRLLEERRSVDAAVFGEGEQPFSDFLDICLSRDTSGPIRGLAFRKGQDVVAGPHASGLPPDQLLSPYLSRALRVVRMRAGSIVFLETARGCPFTCLYCDCSHGERQMRFFDLARLQEELDLLQKDGYNGGIALTDAVANLGGKRAVRLFEILAQWSGMVSLQLRAELLDQEQVSALAAIPHVTVDLGIQSTNMEALGNVKRSFEPGRSAESIRRLLRFPNIQVHLQLILGLPGDTHGSFKRSLDWALAFTPLPTVHVFDLVLLEGSPLLGIRERFGLRMNGDALATGNYSFSPEDLMRSSWLAAVYNVIKRDRLCLELFARRLRRGARPADLLEQLALTALGDGTIPPRRVLLDDPNEAAGLTAAYLARTGILCP